MKVIKFGGNLYKVYNMPILKQDTVMPITQTSDLFKANLKGTGDIIINWGDGNTNTYTLTSTAQLVSHTYTGSYIGTSKSISLTNPERITSFDSNYSDGGTAFGFNLKYMPNCTYFTCGGSNTVTGNLSSMPNCTYFSCGGSNTITGNLSSIPNCTIFSCQGSNTVTGNLSSMPNCTFFSCVGSNTVTGNLSSMPNCTYFSCQGSNTVTGNLSSMPNCTFFNCGGSNTVTGNLSSMPNCTFFSCQGSNTVTGNLSSIPNCTLFSCSGSNTVTGNLSGISTNIGYILLAGNNTVAYSTFSTSKLCYFEMRNTIFTTAQENEILQGVWDNRAVSKTRSERYINVSGAVGSATLDATGLSLKSQLQAYISLPGTTTWTVINR